MRTRLVWILLFGLMMAAGAAWAQETPPDPPAELSDEDWSHHQGGDVSFGGRIEVKPGEVRHGDVTSIGGTAVIAGTVHGEVTVVGGVLDLGGTVDGNVTAVASRAVLRDGARVGGDFVNVGGPLQRGNATVEGEVVNVGIGFPLPGLGPLGFVGSFFTYFAVLELLLIFLTLLLVSALVPERIRFLSEETPVRWPGALLAGIGGYAGLFIVLFLLVITLLGIPLAFLLWCVFFVFKTMALAGIFHLVGSSLGRALGREMSLLGAVLLGFLPFASIRLLFSFLGFPVSLLGWLAIWMPLQIVAVGLMLLTRGGGRRPAIPVAAPAALTPTPPSAGPVPTSAP